MTKQSRVDHAFMAEALALAKIAQQQGEIPIGALVVYKGQVIGKGYNRSVAASDPSAHAEVVALRAAARHLGNYRLEQTTLYVTLEPCLMCCGALLQARIERLVYGAREPRMGAVVSLYDTLMAQGTQHHVAITEGVSSDQCARLVQVFFKNKRLSRQ